MLPPLAAVRACGTDGVVRVRGSAVIEALPAGGADATTAEPRSLVAVDANVAGSLLFAQRSTCMPAIAAWDRALRLAGVLAAVIVPLVVRAGLGVGPFGASAAECAVFVLLALAELSAVTLAPLPSVGGVMMLLYLRWDTATFEWAAITTAVPRWEGAHSRDRPAAAAEGGAREDGGGLSGAADGAPPTFGSEPTVPPSPSPQGAPPLPPQITLVPYGKITRRPSDAGTALTIDAAMRTGAAMRDLLGCAPLDDARAVHAFHRLFVARASLLGHSFRYLTWLAGLLPLVTN